MPLRNAKFPAALKVTSPLGTTIESNLTEREFTQVCKLLKKWFAMDEAERR